MRDVLLIDDHSVMRALLRQILETHTDIVIVGEAEDGEHAVQCAMRLQPSVALVDCHLPRLSGVEVTKLIKTKSPGTTIIGLTAGEPNGDEMEMIEAGAAAVLNKADVLHHLYPLIVNSCAEKKPQAATTTSSRFSSVPLRGSLR